LTTLEAATSDPVVIALATEHDRSAIYRLRHIVYAQELRQHAVNETRQLSDSLDAFNTYLVARRGSDLVGFISITPPGRAYSIDKYLAREELPFPGVDSLYEVRLLTVRQDYRLSEAGAEIAGLLVYAALRWVEALGGQRIVAIGRREVMGLYRKIGLQPLGRHFQAGNVAFELMTATLDELRQKVPHYIALLRHYAERIDWQLKIPFEPTAHCPHGGEFFGAIGEDFDHLERRHEVINADVLDAWFPPCPAVVATLREHLPWLLGTSPPERATGLVRAIARARGVTPESVLVGAGSSNLIFLAFRQWVNPQSRVLLLDPTYAEYAHVCERVIGCQVDRLSLSRSSGYCCDPAELMAAVAGRYDLVVIVNPNNPTGQHLPRAQLERVLQAVAPGTRLWIDEAYIDYVAAEESVERLAANLPNVVVCKSLSKVYSLSGARAAYLCGSPRALADLRPWVPPWAVSLPGQAAAVLALQAPEYFAARYRETHHLRNELIRQLMGLNNRLQIMPGVANFVLVHLPQDGPDASFVVERCRKRGLFLRDAGGMGRDLGRYALRIAVKDAETQQRMLGILAGVW
jgi:histidinol-phosphate/aromatic aminotransferase/cobyric acid decarboxylase-like protein/N-acyl-L-homoserine lactone synthetase